MVLREQSTSIKSFVTQVSHNEVVDNLGIHLFTQFLNHNSFISCAVEKEFSTEWQSVLDSTIRRLLSDAEKTILTLSTTTAQSFAQSLRGNGVDAARLNGMLQTANRSGISAVKALFSQMGVVAVDAQRDLSRELLPAVKQKMKRAYTAVNNAPRGSGSFNRMKSAMENTSSVAVQGMFDDAMRTLLAGIEELIKRLKTMIESSTSGISKSMNTVFSICWDDQQAEALIDPEMKQRMRECRDKLLPALNKLVDIQGEACDILGIEREEVELDVMGVETFEQTLARKKEECIKRGDMFNLCDSDNELDIQQKVKVKGEKMGTSKKPSSSSAADDDVINLCDSDSDDDDDKKPAAKPINTGRVKAEYSSSADIARKAREIAAQYNL